METFTIIYTLLGGLGIFFYGMKTMSDALQQAANDVISNAINSLTTNRIMAVAVGCVVTMIVQSSSITTVMVVGLANAGLMQLTQAIGVIFGTNIGTTITGWVISIKIGKYGLLFIGLGIFPLLFSKSDSWKQIGRCVFGVGLVFMGLEYMSEAFKPLRSNKEFIQFLAHFSGNNYASYAASIIMGCILTMIVQSSSAMLGITIALASTGIINLNTSVALVMGENIGTTITAILASVGTSTNAKRAARAHACFNIFGVCILFTIIPWWIELVEYIGPGKADFVAADGSKPHIAAHIALSHSMFNIFCTLAFLPFINQLAAFVTKITPDESIKEKKTKPQLMVVGEVSDLLPATSIVQAASEVKKMKEIVDRAFNMTRQYLQESTQEKLFKVSEYERITDSIQKEVTLFLCAVMEKPMSAQQTRKTAALIKAADELESISDYLERMVIYKSKFKEGELGGTSLEELLNFEEKVREFYEYCSQSILRPYEADMKEANSRSEELRLWADNIRDRHLDRVSKGEYAPLSALTYSDMVVALRKIRAHSANIVEAYSTLQGPDKPSNA